MRCFFFVCVLFVLASFTTADCDGCHPQQCNPLLKDHACYMKENLCTQAMWWIADAPPNFLNNHDCLIPPPQPKENPTPVRPPWLPPVQSAPPQVVSVTGSGSLFDCTLDNRPYIKYAFVGYDSKSAIESVPNGLFMDCVNLECVYIGPSVTYIGEHAFAGCRNLRSIYFPDNVKTIDDCAFSRCINLREISINANTEFFNSCPDGPRNLDITRRGLSYEDVTDQKVEVVSGTLTFVKDVMDGFNTVFEIKEELSKIVKIIGDYVAYKHHFTMAIFNCPIERIGNFAFAFNYELESVEMKDCVKTIGDKAFFHCAKLSSVVLSNSLETIGYDAFRGCSSLNRIKIPSSVKQIGNCAFAECKDLIEINVNESNKKYSSFDGVLFDKEEERLIQFPGGKTKCIIPDSLVSIFPYAFQTSDKLVEFEVSSNNKYYSTMNGVLFDKDATTLILYPAGRQNEEYVIPESVTTITNSAFERNSFLTSVVLQDRVSLIEKRAFVSCRNLNSVIFMGDTEPTCKNDAFSGVDKLSTISVPFDYSGDTFCGIPVTRRSSLVNFTINNLNDFVKFSQYVSRRSSQLKYNVLLNTDLDLTNIQFSPVGMKDDGSCNPFSGVFEGNHHEIRGISTGNTNSAALFCLLNNAEIANLGFHKSCSFVADISAALSSYASGNIVLRNIVNKASNSGKYSGGLIARIYQANYVNVLIDNCSNEGSFDSEQDDSRIGGIIGEVVSNNNINITIISTRNSGNIVGNRKHHGGLIGLVDKNNDIFVYLRDCENFGNFTNREQTTNALYAAGFICTISSNKRMTMVAEYIVNYGYFSHKQRSTNAAAAGFVGNIGRNVNSSFTIDNVVNNGNFFTRNAGGLIESVSGNNESIITIKNCVNNGAIELFDGDACYPGGLVGMFTSKGNNFNVTMINNTNNGSVTATSTKYCNIGGVIGVAWSDTKINMNLVNNVNNALVKKNAGSGGSILGGIIGNLQESTDSIIVINHGINNGNVEAGPKTGSINAGGIVGSAGLWSNNHYKVKLINCENRGTIQTSDGKSGGLVGNCYDQAIVYVDIFNCINKGIITGTGAYGIAEKVHDSKNVVSMGTVEGSTKASFWTNCSSSSSLFSYQQCHQCSGNVKIFNKNDTYYFTEDGNRVDWVLNNVSASEHYGENWNENLDFSS